jgi:hypothetical protein
MSNIQAIRFALTPCAEESLVRYAYSTDNMGWYGMANHMRVCRNYLYTDVAITIIATIGAFLAVTGTALQFTCVIVAALSASLAIVSAVALYNATTLIQTFVNSGEYLGLHP